MAPMLVTGILCQKNIPHLFYSSLSMSLSAYSFLHFRLQFGYSFFHCKSLLSGVYLHMIPQQYICLLKLSRLVSGTWFRLEPSKPNILDLKYWNKYTTLTPISNNPFLRVTAMPTPDGASRSGEQKRVFLNFALHNMLG